MLDFDFNFDYVVKKHAGLERMLSTDPQTKEKLQGLIKSVLIEARLEIVDAATRAMKSDPRGAARAVRTTVYEKILGGNVNIYNPRKAHGKTSYVPARKGSTGRGGNRKERSGETERYMSYDGLDRGFVLRWVNSGMTKTSPRKIKFKQNDKRKQDKWNRNPNSGNRGAIAARNFFMTAGKPAMDRAMSKLSKLIEQEFGNIINETDNG